MVPSKRKLKMNLLCLFFDLCSHMNYTGVAYPSPVVRSWLVIVLHAVPGFCCGKLSIGVTV
jgi:hypothetical protein